jgi:Reverse transcriptase (RNA-dependent DNA polymerase)
VKSVRRKASSFVQPYKTYLVYLDDVIVYSGSRSAHLAHVAEVLTLLGNAGLSLQLKKCHFFSETVDYLGHVMRPGRLGVAEKNTTALKTAPLPRTQTELRSFLGLCNVYRRFVPRFSAIAAPLNVFYAMVRRPNWVPYRQRLSRHLPNSGTDYCPLRFSLYPQLRVVFA